MSNFFKFLLLSTFLYGAVDNSFAGCPPNELERSNPREIITNTPIYNAGKLVAIGRGEEVLLIARDRDGKIVGITDAQTNRAINLADLLASATDKSVSGISKPEWDPCGGMGGDSFVLDMGVEKLRLVEVDGSRAAEPPYWQPILAPAFPSDAELGAVPMDNNQTERNKRCEGQKNQCLAAVEGDWKS